MKQVIYYIYLFRERNMPKFEKLLKIWEIILEQSLEIILNNFLKVFMLFVALILMNLKLNKSKKSILNKKTSFFKTLNCLKFHQRAEIKR